MKIGNRFAVSLISFYFNRIHTFTRRTLQLSSVTHRFAYTALKKCSELSRYPYLLDGLWHLREPCCKPVPNILI